MEYKARVSGILKHYFKLLFEKAGLTWGEDNEAEIDDMIDDIFQAIEN